MSSPTWEPSWATVSCRLFPFRLISTVTSVTREGQNCPRRTSSRVPGPDDGYITQLYQRSTHEMKAVSRIGKIKREIFKSYILRSSRNRGRAAIREFYLRFCNVGCIEQVAGIVCATEGAKGPTTARFEGRDVMQG